MASVPAPHLMNVERVVIACEFDSGLSEAERRGICEQLVRKAGVHTQLPVSLASPADLDPAALARQSAQLLLRVTGQVSDAGQGRKALALEITPVRVAVRAGPMASQKASASLMRVQGDWIVQGPIEAFEKLLGGGPKRLHRPIRSDS